MLKKSLGWLLTMFMLLSYVTAVAAERTGVSEVSWSLADGVYTVTWTNPADEDFVKNELYKHDGTEFKLVEDLGTATTTSVTAANGENRYMFKSYFSNEETVEVYTGKYNRYTDKSIFPGINLELRNDQTTTGELVGSVGTTYDEAHSGEKSAYFSMDHGYQTNVYHKLYKEFGALQHGQKYCLSFWVKVPEGTTSYIFDFKNSVVSSSYQGISLGSEKDLKDGVWHNITSYFVTDGTNTTSSNCYTWVEFLFTRKGTVYIDDLELYMVDENNNRWGADDAFAKAGTFEDKKGITDLTVETAANPDTSPSLSWTNPTDGTVLYNDIYVSIDGGEQIPVTSLPNGEASYEDTGRVTKNAVYTYTIKTTYDDYTVVETSASRAIIRHYTTGIYGGWDMTANEPAANVIMPRTNRIAPTLEKQSTGDGSLKIYRPHRGYLGNGQTVINRYITLDSSSQYTLSFDYYSTMYEVGVFAVNEKIGNTDATKNTWVSYSKSFTGAASTRIGFNFDWGGVFYLDNIKLVKVGEEDVNLLETVLGMDCDYEVLGVENFVYTSPDVNTIELTWEKPAMMDADKNELYVAENGERRLIASFENGETAYTYQGAEAGGRYDFVMVSYFGEVQKEVTLTAYAKRNTSSSTYVPGWIINYRDPNPERFRGQIGVDREIKHSGNSSLFVELEHTYTSMYYAQLYRYISAIDQGKTYRVSGWFRSEGFGATPSRIQILFGHDNQEISQKYDMTECDGEWQYFEFVHTVTTGNEALTILLDSQGKVWFDDLEIYEVEDVAGSWEVVNETNLLAGSKENEVIGGDFEYNLIAEPLFVEGDAETKQVNAEVYVGNSIIMNPEAKLMIAVYDGSGKLVKVKTTTWKDAEKEAAEANVEFVPNQHYVVLETDGYEDGYEVKLFVWDDMLPLCTSLSNL